MDKYITIPLCKTSKTRANVHEAKISHEDADLAELNWNISGSGKNLYAKRSTRINGKHTPPVQLHRVIMERILGRPLVKGELVDHVNRDSLDNQRFNLRLATQTQNQANRGKAITNKSGYKGVSWDKRSKKWVAYIRVDGKNHFLGYSQDPKECYEWYCEAARLHFGEFAHFD